MSVGAAGGGYACDEVTSALDVSAQTATGELVARQAASRRRAGLARAAVSA